MLVPLWIFLLVVQHAAGECSQAHTCTGCMANPGCSWCSDAGYSQDRCQEQHQSCSSIEDISSDVEVGENRPLTPEQTEDIVQVRPQSAVVRLRPGSPAKLNLEIAQAPLFPVDIYFLMDLSWSMRKSQKTVAHLGGDIIDGIKKETPNLRTGFGSFVEKNVPPFTSAIPEFNCQKDNKNCAPPYSFYHKASLSDISAEQFNRTVREMPLAGNVDDPEGTLDALMQVMACEKRIGWRNDSRKIILVATDRDFHYALDGKLAGILTPNDGRCHLNGSQGGSGYYTHGELLDYPSISHINSVAQKNNFIIIFAVIPRYFGIYTALKQRIPGSYVARMDADADNIVDLVSDIYREITSTIKVMTSSSGASEVEVKFSSSCTEGGQASITNECSNVQLGTTIKFEAEFSTNQCLKSNQTITISPVGLKEDLTVTVIPGCDCPCEASGDPPDFLDLSPKCSSAGYLHCGLCQCEKGNFGKMCQCEESEIWVDDEQHKECKDKDGVVCSGRGDCVCGVCNCTETSLGTVTGKLCECDDWTCIKGDNGKLCSGHGQCQCGNCTCHAGWMGGSCDCPKDIDDCISPFDQDECSGNGECECGVCKCFAVATGNPLKYIGTYCETDPSGEGACGEVTDCVECLRFGTGPQAPSCKECVFEVEAMENKDVPRDIFDADPCNANNDDGCQFTFSAKINSTGSVWVVLHTFDGREARCPQIALWSGISAGALVLLLGLLSILFYKCYIVIDDKRQYAQFRKEVDNMKWEVNQMPNDMYKSPITTFENPMFGKAIH